LIQAMPGTSQRRTVVPARSTQEGKKR
jgi:hypothetical protein